MIDLRSDTVTKPSPAMRAAMASAVVGDDVFGDDPTVCRLEVLAASLFGKEAGLFLASGTQSNLAAVMAHCQRGDEYIVGMEAHSYRYEGGGCAVLGSVQPQPLANQPDGTLRLEEIAAAVKPLDDHFAKTKLLALENTIGGKVLPLAYMREAAALARKLGLSTHLDGARIFNAAVKLGVPASALGEGFDTVSVCLSKGLGAPAGTVLVGTRALVREARRWRKMLGGGMRQSGILAAAGIYALENNVARLAEDHANAQRLADGLREIPGISVDAPQTNMVFARVPPQHADALAHHLLEHGINTLGGSRLRLVTHLDVSEKEIDLAIEAFKAYRFG